MLRDPQTSGIFRFGRWAAELETPLGGLAVEGHPLKGANEHEPLANRGRAGYPRRRVR